MRPMSRSMRTAVGDSHQLVVRSVPRRTSTIITTTTTITTTSPTNTQRRHTLASHPSRISRAARPFLRLRSAARTRQRAIIITTTPCHEQCHRCTLERSHMPGRPWPAPRSRCHLDPRQSLRRKRCSNRSPAARVIIWETWCMNQGCNQLGSYRGSLLTWDSRRRRFLCRGRSSRTRRTAP